MEPSRINRGIEILNSKISVQEKAHGLHLLLGEILSNQKDPALQCEEIRATWRALLPKFTKDVYDETYSGKINFSFNGQERNIEAYKIVGVEDPTRLMQRIEIASLGSIPFSVKGKETVVIPEVAPTRDETIVDRGASGHDELPRSKDQTVVASSETKNSVADPLNSDTRLERLRRNNNIKRLRALYKITDKEIRVERIVAYIKGILSGNDLNKKQIFEDVKYTIKSDMKEGGIDPAIQEVLDQEVDFGPEVPYDPDIMSLAKSDRTDLQKVEICLARIKEILQEKKESSEKKKALHSILFTLTRQESNGINQMLVLRSRVSFDFKGKKEKFPVQDLLNFLDNNPGIHEIIATFEFSDFQKTVYSSLFPQAPSEASPQETAPSTPEVSAAPEIEPEKAIELKIPDFQQQLIGILDIPGVSRKKIDDCFAVIQSIFENESLDLKAKNEALQSIVRTLLLAKYLDFGMFILSSTLKFDLPGIKEKVMLSRIYAFLNKQDASTIPNKITVAIELSKERKDILEGKSTPPETIEPKKPSYSPPRLRNLVVDSLKNALIYGTVTLILSKGNPLSALKAVGLTVLASAVDASIRHILRRWVNGRSSRIYGGMAVTGALILAICKVTQTPITNLGTLAVNGAVWALNRRNRHRSSSLGVVVF